MYKYTRKHDGGWRFIPPADARQAGIVMPVTFKDGRAARYEIPRLIKRVEDFRKGLLSAGNVGPNSTLIQVYRYYTTTNHFKSLAYISQKNYDSTFASIQEAPIKGGKLGNVKIKDLTSRICDQAYQHWCNTVSVSKANQCSRVLSLVLNFCISIEMIQSNPMASVIKKTHKTNSKVWTHQQVLDFLSYAFSNYKYRSIGLIVLLCYEFAQRPNDIRLLKWSSIDFKEKKLSIKQTKRGATVELPISDNIIEMLRQQENDWGWQDYVIPFEKPSDGGYRPMSRVQIPLYANKVKEALNMPEDLLVGNLRKSGIVEMIDAGVDHLQIMSVTGHQNVSSLNPYHKHTFASAKSALEKRKSNAN
jgi:integrase